MDITRKQIGKINTDNIYDKKFEYYKNGVRIVDETVIKRIKKNCIPPAWTDVMISSSDTSYLQVIGYDSKDRKQYKYHPMWNELARKEKYKRLEQFIYRLPILIRHINKNLSNLNVFSKEHIILLIIKILTKTYSRIGNDVYTEENNTYGLTTLLKKHINININNININYIGKKNIKQSFSFTDEICSRALKKLLLIPGDRLFKTADHQDVRSADVNNYIKDIMKGEYTSKDFRTYASNIMLLELLYKKKNNMESDTEAKKFLNECCDRVASIIGHTTNVSKTNYIYPIIIEQYTHDYNNFIKSKLSVSDLLKKFN